MKRVLIIFGWFILGATLFFSGCAAEKEKEVTAFTGVDSLLTEWKQSRKLNGVVALRTPDTLIQSIVGYARNTTQLALTDQDVFYLGSLAKQFTAMAVLRSVDKDLLSLEDTLGTYLPQLPTFMHGITVRQMLNHTSGLPDYYNEGFFVSGMTNERVIDSVATVDSLDFPSGDTYSYSNSAYVFLSVIVEKANGMSFGEFMQNEFFEPLGMRSTMVYDTTRPMLPPRALGHYPDGRLNDYNAFTTGGGGIFSNARDMFVWVDALNTGKLVSDDLLEEMYKPAVLNDGTLSYYGFGWRLDENGKPIYRHSGSLAGYRTYLYRNRETGTDILLMSNFTNNASGLVDEMLELIN